MKIDLSSEDAFVILQQEPAADPGQEDTHTAFQEPEELIEHILSSGAIPVQNDQEVQRDMEEQPNPMAAQATPGAQLDQEIDQEPTAEQEEVPKKQEHEQEADQAPEEKIASEDMAIEETILQDNTEPAQKMVS